MTEARPHESMNVLFIVTAEPGQGSRHLPGGVLTENAAFPGTGTDEGRTEGGQSPGRPGRGEMGPEAGPHGWRAGSGPARGQPGGHGHREGRGPTRSPRPRPSRGCVRLGGRCRAAGPQRPPPVPSSLWSWKVLALSGSRGHLGPQVRKGTSSQEAKAKGNPLRRQRRVPVPGTKAPGPIPAPRRRLGAPGGPPGGCSAVKG